MSSTAVDSRAAQRAARVAPWRKPLLTAHIAVTVSVLGADMVVLALGISSVRGAEPQTVYPAMHLVATWLMGPLAFASLATGLLQGLLSKWGLVRYWWVTIKLTIATLLTAVVWFVLVPGLARAADAATGGPAALTDAQRLVYVLGPSASTALLVLSIALAVYKPGWRFRKSHQAAEE